MSKKMKEYKESQCPYKKEREKHDAKERKLAKKIIDMNKPKRTKK